MKKTARFSVLREKSLERLFTIKKLSETWREIVRSQMRSMDIVDLHDYYDFNTNIESRAKEIRSRVLKCQYKASSPLIYRLEKCYEICRHLMIPSPSDALVFQTITEHLVGPLKAAQPTKKAYYSRDKHRLSLPHEFREAHGYPWFILWPKFQKDIWKFTDDCAYLVVTDVTNFFDNIGLRELRHIVSSRIKVDEVVLDLLFNIVEQLSWNPDYLPLSLKGLPTINLEAFRLLPHVMLFEVDEVLNSQANGNFVRWMDDINIGVDSKDDAYSILGSVNDVLKSRGLALNLSKTTIYTSAQAKKHFLVDENVYLDKVQKSDPNDPAFDKIKADFVRNFRRHCKDHHLRNWDKVTKRYFTIAANLRISDLLKYTHQMFIEHPEVPRHVLSYIGRSKFSKSLAGLILSLLKDVRRYDDVTLFEFCRLITNMEIPRTKTAMEFIKAVERELARPKSDFDRYCYIWFLAKYGREQQLMNFIRNSKISWANEQFLARQVVSVLPRLVGFDKEAVSNLLNEQEVAGPREAASVATNLCALLNSERVVGNLYAYLFPATPQRPYPLPKYLILTAVLSSEALKLAERKKVLGKLPAYITDPWYLHWLHRRNLLN